ncbi:hypothetical protein [Psychrobacter sp. 16-MNA-CIBAN-0192]
MNTLVEPTPYDSSYNGGQISSIRQKQLPVRHLAKVCYTSEPILKSV